jgi:hypothetical protein
MPNEDAPVIGLCLPPTSTLTARLGARYDRSSTEGTK